MMEELVEFLAALKQMEKALEADRRAVLRLIGLVEKKLEEQKPVVLERLVIVENSRPNL